MAPHRMKCLCTYFVRVMRCPPAHVCCTRCCACCDPPLPYPLQATRYALCQPQPSLAQLVQSLTSTEEPRLPPIPPPVSSVPAEPTQQPSEQQQVPEPTDWTEPPAEGGAQGGELLSGQAEGGARGQAGTPGEGEAPGLDPLLESVASPSDRAAVVEGVPLPQLAQALAALFKDALLQVCHICVCGVRGLLQGLIVVGFHRKVKCDLQERSDRGQCFLCLGNGEFVESVAGTWWWWWTGHKIQRLL